MRLSAKEADGLDVAERDTGVEAPPVPSGPWRTFEGRPRRFGATAPKPSASASRSSNQSTAIVGVSHEPTWPRPSIPLAAAWRRRTRRARTWVLEADAVKARSVGGIEAGTTHGHGPPRGRRGRRASPVSRMNSWPIVKRGDLQVALVDGHPRRQTVVEMRTITSASASSTGYARSSMTTYPVAPNLTANRVVPVTTRRARRSRRCPARRQCTSSQARNHQHGVRAGRAPLQP